MPVPPSAEAPGLAPTGIAGLDDVLVGGLTRPPLPRRGPARRRQDDARSAVSPRRSAPRRGRLLRHPLRNRRRAPRRRRRARLVARRHHPVRAQRRRGEPQGRVAIHHLPPLRGRAHRHHEGIRDAVERVKPARLVFDSLSELRLLAGSRSVTAGRSSRSSSSSSGGGARCCSSTTTAPGQRHPAESLVHGVILLEQASGLRRRSPQAPDHQVPGGGLPGRLPRLRDAARRDRVFPRLVAQDHRRIPTERARAGSLSSTCCWAAGSIAARAPSSPARPASASRPSPRSSPTRRRSAARRWPSSCSRRAGYAAVPRDGLGMASALSRSGRSPLRQVNPAELAPGEFATCSGRPSSRRAPRWSSSTA